MPPLTGDREAFESFLERPKVGNVSQPALRDPTARTAMLDRANERGGPQQYGTEQPLKQEA
eukprot:5770179-Amphidinium_carterae.1